MSFLDFYLFLNWERERERERERGIQNLGIKEKCPQSYLSYFSTGFHWRIFLLSRANRLCSIFLHWLEEPGVLRVSVFFFCLQPRVKWLWFVYPLRTLLKNCLSYCLFPLTGEGSPLPFLGSQPIIWLLSSSFLVSRFLRATRCHPSPVTGYKHLLVLIPTSVTHILS